MNTDYSLVLETLGEADTLQLRAGTGLRDGMGGCRTVRATPASVVGHALASPEVIIVDALPADARFAGPGLLLELGVASGLSVRIQGAGVPFGVLGAYATARRTFDGAAVQFLQSVANLLALKRADQPGDRRQPQRRRGHREDPHRADHRRTGRFRPHPGGGPGVALGLLIPRPGD